MLFLEKLEQKRIYIILVILICILIGTIYAGVFMPKKFISSTSMMLMKTENGENEEIKNNGTFELADNIISTFEELIKSDSSINEVKKAINTTEKITGKNISLKRISDSDTFQIKVSSFDSNVSLEINLRIAEIFSNKIESMYKNTQVYIIDEAHIIESNNVFSIILYGIIGLIIGILIDVIYILFLIQVEKNVKNDKEIESDFSLKNLALIPIKNMKKNMSVELISSEMEKSLTNKAFKELRSNIQFLNVNNDSKNIILITSCLEKEGKSYVSANLATSYANIGKKVILIDADLKNGRQSKIFNIPNDVGLSNFLSNLDVTGVEINERINYFIKETAIKNLNVITSGSVPPNSSELLTTSKLPEMLKDLGVFYDVIILDGTTILNEVDSLILSRYSTSTIIVSVSKKTRKDDLWKTKKDIQNVGGRIIGVVLNKVKIKKKVSNEIEEKTFLKNIKEKIKNYILKIKESRNLKLLPESTVKQEDVCFKIKNENQIQEENKDIRKKTTPKVIKKIKRTFRKSKIKFYRRLKQKNKESIKKESVNEENNIQVEPEKNEKIPYDNIVLVVVDALNATCRAFSKTCYTEKFVRGIDRSDGFMKAYYSSYVLRKSIETLILKYSLTKKQAMRIDPLVYATLVDYDECFFAENKIESRKADLYVNCMARDYMKKPDESKQSYIERCKQMRIEELYNFDIEIEYDVTALWENDKMKLVDKVSMNKFAKMYTVNSKEVVEENQKQPILNPIKKIEEVKNNLVNIKQVKAKSVKEIAKEVENELNIQNNISNNMQMDFSEIIVEDVQDRNYQFQKEEETKQEAKILKKIQKEKHAKKRREEKAKKQKEKEKKFKKREEQRRAKELEREKKIEEARIEEELLVDNLYPKTKNNKNL